jgi:hypothetical protein
MSTNVDQCFKSYPRNKSQLQHSNLRKATCNVSPNCFKVNSDPFRTGTVIVDENYVSINNKLVGGQNPKTLIPPIIPRPAYSMEWRNDDMIVPNKINGRTNENLYRSGYLSEEYVLPPSNINPKTVEKAAPEGGYKPTDRSPLNSAAMTRERLGTQNIPDTIAVEHFGLPDYSAKDWQDQINTAKGYNKSQFVNSAFPANEPQGLQAQSSAMTDYNRQLFTQTVQPGLYYREDVVEPVNSNIGISFQQQFLPRTFDKIENGDLIVVDHDPNFAPEPKTRLEPVLEPSLDNVYDPRFNGYGSSNRNYIDNVTGQPRFAYDDVTAVRMPNYITRSKIDTHNFADVYGTVTDAGKSLNEIRPLAQTAFFADSEQFRNDITTSAMRKINAAMWQRRQAPLSVSKR